MEHFCPQIQVKTKKKKKRTEHFFPDFKWTPTLRCTPESNYWGGCRCTPYSTQTTGRDTAKLVGGYISPSPLQVSAPMLAMKGTHVSLLLAHRVFCEQIKLNPTEATQSMFCFDFTDKLVALTANRKLGISKFYELLSEPQTNQPQFITKCSHCIYQYPLLSQTFKTCDCSHTRSRVIGRVVKLLCTHVAFVLVRVCRIEYLQRRQLFYN